MYKSLHVYTNTNIIYITSIKAFITIVLTVVLTVVI